MVNAASRRSTAVMIVVVLASSLLVGGAVPASATHFRFRDLTWRQTSGHEVELTMRIADRRSYYGSSIAVGAPFTTTVEAGDGNSSTLNGEVIAINTVDDWFIAEVRGFHTYATKGPYTVTWQDCCTLSSLLNSPDSSLQTTSVVDMRNGNRASPTSLVSPIVHLPKHSGVQSFAIPASDADGENVAFRLATSAESLVTQPPGLTVDARTGMVSWDTTGRLNGLWMVTVVLEDTRGAGTMNTFLINLGSTASNPPEWISPTPADRSQFSVTPGEATTFTLAARDPDGDATIITPLAAPSGLTCGGTASGASYELDCTWRPTATGSNSIAFQAQDSNGAAAGLRSYRVNAPRYVALGDSYSSGQGAGAYERGTDFPKGNHCRRSANAYPNLVAGRRGIPSSLDFVACSGARTYHLNEAQHDPTQPPQFDTAALSADVELVTVSIGGNDSGFVEILEDCADGEDLLPFNDCSGEPEKTEDKVQAGFKRLRGEVVKHGGNPKTVALKELYREILTTAPRARVLVVGYPQFYKSSGTLFFRCSGMKKADQLWVNEKVQQINDLVKAEAEKFGFEFVETSSEFVGHRLCELGGGEKKEWFNDLEFRAGNPPIDPSSYHPDADGQEAIKRRVLAVWKDKPRAPLMRTGERSVRRVIVDGLKKAVSFVTEWPGSDVEMRVTSPSGMVYDRASPLNSAHLLGPTFEVFEIADPESGEWVVELFGADLGADGEPVEFSASTTDVPNTVPQARIDYRLDGRHLSLDGLASTDAEGPIVRYEWFINTAEGTTAELEGAVADYHFERGGNFGVTLRVIDEAGASGFLSIADGITISRRTSSPPDCTVTGSAGDDVLIGTAGDDVLCGKGGNDRLLGRGGLDRLRGGPGRDRLRGGGGADRLYGHRGADRLYGGRGPDRLYGGPGDDRLRGGPGHDRLRGGPGDDRLFGGHGDDRLRGNLGHDLLGERPD